MSNRQRSFGESRRRGWGMGLYRNRSEGWIGGVCAGLAAHWDVPNWVVRLAAVALLMFTGSLAFWLYVIAWVGIAPKASRWSELPDEEVEIEMEEEFAEEDPVAEIVEVAGSPVAAPAPEEPFTHNLCCARARPSSPRAPGGC